jgi:hypothetical protein
MIVQPDGERVPRIAQIYLPGQTLRIEVDLLTGRVIEQELIAHSDDVDSYSVMDKDGVKDLQPLAAELAKHVFWNETTDVVRRATVEWG